MKLNANLVVLSACQTGIGKAVRGEGIVGIARGFFYAGAERVLASYWEVSDNATAQLMVRFYEGIFEKKLSPLAALRAAQVSILREPQWKLPFYWAAFQLQGEWK